MPELGPKNLSFIKKVLEQPRSIDDLRALAKEHHERYIGNGTEVVVVEHKEEPDKVAAFNFKHGLENPEEAKKLFYLHRFFSTLFPHNFPHFYAASGKDPNNQNENFSGTIREKIKENRISFIKKAIEEKIGFSLMNYPHKYPFKNVQEVCEQLGITVLVDTSKQNFITRDDGGEYFVDTLKCPNVEEWDIDKIVKYMEENKYSKRDIDIVKASTERLIDLNNQNKH